MTSTRLAMVLCLCMAANVQAAGTPQRIASIGLCSDQILLMLVPRERIVTLSREAANPAVSFMAAAVGDIPLNSATAEDILRHQPDLVLSTDFAASDATRMLQRLGYRVESLPLPTSVAGIRDMLQQAGAWLGEQEKAAQLIAQMDEHIARAQQRNAAKPVRRAIIYSPNGYTIGANTLEHDVLQHAGYRNLAADYGVRDFRQISLETLATLQPERILIDNYAYNQDSLAYAYVNHPVVRKLVPDAHRMYVPAHLRDCAGPQVADEIAWLADHR